MAARHLVTRLDLTFNRQINLDDFQHARRQIVALSDLTTLGFQLFSKSVSVRHGCCSASCSSWFCFSSSVRPSSSQRSRGSLLSLSASMPPATQHRVDTCKQAGFQDLQFFRQVFLRLLQLHLFDFQRACLFSTPSRVKTCTSITVPETPFGTQRRVFNVRRFLTEDRGRSSFSSGVSWVSPLGVTLPTGCHRRSLQRRYTRYRFIQQESAASPTLGMSAVISSGPSLVSRHARQFWMWMVVSDLPAPRARRPRWSLRSCSRSKA